MTKHTLTLQNCELTAYLTAQHRPDAPTLLVFSDSPAEADALAALLPDYIALLSLPEANWEHAFTPWHAPNPLPQAMYFSLGDKEAQSRNPRMAAVQTATEAVFARWQQYTCPSTLEINAGGHFDNVPQRLAQAAAWLIEAA